jgi:tetratricopeptide (TPR) repeat protein
LTDTVTLAPATPSRADGPRPRDSDGCASPQAVTMRAAARAAGDAHRPEAAERLFRACLESFPDFAGARVELALLLLSQGRPQAALEEADRLLQLEPGHPGHMFFKASICLRLGDHEPSIALHTAALAAEPRSAHGWLSLGHALRPLGRVGEAVAAYRRALDLRPHFGDAWWSLADLKTERFSPNDVGAMQRALQADDLAPDDHVLLHYALGKAKEDQGDYAASFAHYAQGARLRRRTLSASPDAFPQLVQRSRTLLTAEFFAARAGQGSDAPDPIFVVGLPRAGSTLVEQILSSHSQVESTHELPDILRLAGRFGRSETPLASAAYPEGLTELSGERIHALGDEYLAGARVHRRQGRPFFIDKMPNNFEYLGLIHLILPKARIIDVRRHPLGCGLSVFKQHFAQGQTYSYDLGEIGRHYAGYVALMDHYDAVLPGRVHRVFYEQLVADPEGEVRRLLDHCRLPYEAACLRPHENGRAVRTPSAEQVRQPIFQHATDHWRNFEPWLAPLKDSLGPVLDAYGAPSADPSSAPRPRRRRSRSAPAARR